MKQDNSQERAELTEALQSNAPKFDIVLTKDTLAKLVDYYVHVLEWNPRLHLVAPCSPHEFAVRHLLESVYAARLISDGARIIDIGSGAGLPGIPLLIAREDVTLTFVESARRKAIFIREALRRVNCHQRAHVIAERFERLPAHQSDFVTCRALDNFSERFAELVAWTPPTSTLLFFGGDSLRTVIEHNRLAYRSALIPESEHRFIFSIR